MNKKIIGLFVCTLLITTALPVAVAMNVNQTSEKTVSNSSGDDDWPMFCHDSGLSGCSPCSIVEGNTIWEYDTGAFIDFSCAVIADGKLYIGVWNRDLSANVICLDAETGGYEWTSPSIGEFVWSTPAVAYGRVYISSLEEGNVCCLNADDGSILWNYLVGDKVSSGLNVIYDKVYFGSNDKNVYCLDAYTGALVWTYTTGGAVGSPAVSDGKVYVSSAKTIYYLDAEGNGDGTTDLIRSIELSQDWYITSPTVVDNKLYVGVAWEYLYCLDASNGNEVWRFEVDDELTHATVADGKVYVGVWDDLYCINATGQKLWSYDTDGIVYSPAVADGDVYVISADGGAKLYSFDAETGEKNWERRMIQVSGGASPRFSNTPTIANGKVYNAFCPYDKEDGSKIYCFGKDGITKSRSKNPTDLPDVRFSFEKGRLYLFGKKIPKFLTKNIPENTTKIINRGRLIILTVESKENANIESIKLYVNDNECDEEPIKQGPFNSPFRDPFYVWAFTLDNFLGTPWCWVTYNIRFEAFDEQDNLVESDEMKLQIFSLRKW